ncbi:MAG: SsrA-binding protein SmpB, partial [Campylobacterales bacterium]
MSITVVATNKKAFHDYEITDRYEAGIELKGSEVKAIRKGRVNLKDSYVRIINQEAWVIGMHISHLDQTNPHFKPDERRPRRLLLHKKEILKLLGYTQIKGMTLVPIRLYFNERNKAKLEIGLARGKDLHDKR